MKEISFSEQVKRVIKSIPYGRVATYGQIAFMAGNYRGARQVAWVLHSSSESDDLPWHRVINSKGGISLPQGEGYEQQKNLLIAEGIQLDENDRINLKDFLWQDA